MRGEHLTVQLLWDTVGLLVLRFIDLSTQWMKEMRTWGLSEVISFFFVLFSLLRLKTRGARGVSHLAKINELRSGLKCQQGDTS